MKHQVDYPHLTPSAFQIKKGELRLGELITNIHSKSVWPAEQYDIQSLDGDRFFEHNKFRKMIPLT